jgi:hypothetical protein
LVLGAVDSVVDRRPVETNSVTDDPNLTVRPARGVV